MDRILMVLLAAVAFALLTVSGPALAGTLTYEGSTTIGENILPDAVIAFMAKTGITFSAIGGLGSGKGFKAVMDGKVDMAGVSRSLTEEERLSNPYYQNIGFDAIAVYVHSRNPVTNLSRAQIADIFTGKITNWKDVGGMQAPITVITEILTGERGTIQAFSELVLLSTPIVSSQQIDKPHDCVLAVAANEYAVTHASLAFAEPGVKAINVNGVSPLPIDVRSGKYPLSRPLLLVAKNKPTGDLNKFFNFMLSSEGQAFVKKQFVPLK